MGEEERSGSFPGHGGLRLFYRFWAPGAPRGRLVLVHGANEHSGRYRHVAAYFARRGFGVYALDQRGYGLSEGARCYVDQFVDYVEDLRRFVGLVAAFENGAGTGVPPVLIGHSLGGLVAFAYGAAYPASIGGVILSSPWFALKTSVSPIEQALAPLLSRLLPHLERPAGIRPEVLSRDPEVVRAYREDPLVGTTATPRWFVECTRAQRRCREELAQRYTLPVLFLQAGDDRLADPEATRAVYDRVPHGRKAFRLYPGKYHEIFNDPGHDEAFAAIVAWLESERLTAA